jgi:signal transduction histidine kinase
MGGVVEVDSGTGAGTRFTVVLPRVVPQPAASPDGALDQVTQ